MAGKNRSGTGKGSKKIFSFKNAPSGKELKALGKVRSPGGLAKVKARVARPKKG